jgi:acyl carrier protein
MENEIKEIIASHLGLEAEGINDKDNFMDDLGADSLDTVELVLQFEEHFGIEIPDEQTEHLTTVGSVIAYIKSNV